MPTGLVMLPTFSKCIIYNGLCLGQYTFKSYKNQHDSKPYHLTCVLYSILHIYHIYSFIRQGIFLLPKEPQKSRSSLKHRSRFLGLFRKVKKHLIGRIIQTDLDIWVILAVEIVYYNQLNMVIEP